MARTHTHTHTHTHARTHTYTHQRIMAHMFNITRHKNLQLISTHCNTLQHVATHCNTLQHTATHYTTLQHTATHLQLARFRPHTLTRTNKKRKENHTLASTWCKWRSKSSSRGFALHKIRFATLSDRRSELSLTCSARQSSVTTVDTRCHSPRATDASCFCMAILAFLSEFMGVAAADLCVSFLSGDSFFSPSSFFSSVSFFSSLSFIATPLPPSSFSGF